MAYQVYYGNIASSGSSGDYTWTYRTLIYDTANFAENRYILNAVLTREANEAGNFEADIPYGNVCYKDVDLYLSYIEVERDGEILWQGRVTSIKMDFDRNKHIYCEGELAYLNDIYVKVDWASVSLETSEDMGEEIIEGLTYYDPVLFFEKYCKLDGSYSGGKAILSNFTGSSTIENELSESTIYGSEWTGDTVYMTAWDALSNCLLDGLLASYKDRVYVNLKRENRGNNTYRRIIELVIFNSDGTFYLGSLPVTSQAIEFGNNLLDLTYSRTAENIVTQVVAYGYLTKGWWIFSNTSEISVTVTDDEMMRRYGLIQKYISVDGTKSTETTLRNAARSALNQNKRDYNDIIEITTNAVDLVDAGVDVDRLDFMKVTRVHSEPHSIDTLLPCTKLVEPLDDPSGKEFTYGRKSRVSSKYQASNDVTASKAYSMSHVTKDYVTNS